MGTRTWNLTMLILSTAILMAACSPKNEGNSSGDAGATTPVSSPSQPKTPQEPIVVTTPVGISAPQAAPEPTTTTTLPAIVEQPVVQPSEPEIVPVGQIDETETAPAAVVIAPIATVTVNPEPVSNQDTAIDVSEPEVIPTPAPVIEITNVVSSNTEPVPAVEPVVTQEPVVSDQDGDDDIVAEGSCLNKKKATVTWYHVQHSDRKNSTTVVCKNNNFKVHIKVKKSETQWTQILTAFFN